MVLPSSISGSGGVGVGFGLRIGAGGGSPSVGAIRSTGVARGTGVGVGVGRLTVVCVDRGAGAGVGVGVGVAAGTERGAIAELRRGREFWLLAVGTKVEPTKHVAAKTSATTKASCFGLSLLNFNLHRSLVRFIINMTR